MIVLLIRHGIAEEAGQNQQDAKRHLTERGRKRLKDAMPGLRLMMKSYGQPLIWSSPLCRAAETAEILADKLNVAPVRHLEAIASGDWHEVFRQLALTESKRPVLLVGHEPSLGSWTGQLCGVCLPFKKGAVSAVKIDMTNGNEGDLLWFIQPGALRLLAHEADQ